MTYKEEFLQSCLILDTETTGTDTSTVEIIESGFVIRDNGEWSMFQELHKPIKTPIPPLVESITYITNEMVEDRPSFLDSKDTFQSVVDGFKDGYAVGHNYIYDMRVLQNNGITLPEKSICSWRMAKKIFNNMPEIEGTSLPYLRFALDLEVPLELRDHRAGHDSYTTAKLVEVLLEIMESTELIDINKPYGPQIEEWLATPIIQDKMSFGKHKGELMTDIPKSYWIWAAKNMDSLNEDSDNFDSDFAASVHKALGID